MKRVLNLFVRILKGRVPLRALGYGFLNKWNYLTKSGNRRYEFERLYLDDADPWNYNGSAYENAKYRETLGIVMERGVNWRKALEVGCSVGVFTRLLATKFGHVTALDVSKEALRIASSHPEAPGNAVFVQADIRTMLTGEKFDAMFFAEMLCYLREDDIPVVCGKIDELLADDGILVMVTGQIESLEGGLYCDRWDRGFSLRYDRVVQKSVADVSRPYCVCVYVQRKPEGNMSRLH